MSKEKPVSIERFSTPEAIAEYSQMARGGLIPQEEQIVRKYFSSSPAQVLDLGCGAGRTTRVLADLGYDVTGIDASKQMIQAARKLYPDLEVEVGNATNLPFDDETIEDVLFSYSGIDGIQPENQRMVALAEVFRVLEPGGIFAFSTNNWLYSLPALVLDRQFLRKFYIQNGNLRRLFSQYKQVPQYSSEEVYFSDPYRQHKQLEAVGFDVVELVGKRDGLARYIEREPYYVARKPRDVGAVE